MSTGPSISLRRAVAAITGAGTASWLALHACSPAVRAWNPGGGHHLRVGPLSVRLVEPPPSAGPRIATVLLHGLMASGDVFGGAYDTLADEGPLIVPDLLGFGRSMRTDLDGAEALGLSAHVAALATTIAELVPPAVPLRIGGHSMGGVLALHLAQQLVERGQPVDRVVTWGAPLYRDRAAGRTHIAGLGGTARLFAFDTPIAHVACSAMCRARRTAAVLAVAASPRLPVAVARRGVLHTWPSYRQAMDTVVLDLTWPSSLRALTNANVAAHLVAGSDDAVVDPVTLAWARRLAEVEVHVVDSSGHELVMTDPLACRAILRAQR